MMGLFISRVFVMVFGYVHPAYECYKAIENHRPEIDQIVFWCKYWIIVALLTICERFSDTFISWFPFYGEAKIALFICLWYPRRRGTTYIYGLIQPYVRMHENQIDRTLQDIQHKSLMMAVFLWEKAVYYGQAKFFEIMQYAQTYNSVIREERRLD